MKHKEKHELYVKEEILINNSERRNCDQSNVVDNDVNILDV